MDTDMRLDIYVGNHCLSCREALRIAREARQIPDLEVRVIDVDQATDPIPGQVAAVPAYVLDGQVVSLGNPHRMPFLALLVRQMEGGQP
jgi:predicted thioredoxin/glutaredoxin